MVVFGAPAYFAKHGRPRHPDELAQHHCVVRITDDPDTEKWRFRVGGRLREPYASAGVFGPKVLRQPTLPWQVDLESDSRRCGGSPRPRG